MRAGTRQLHDSVSQASDTRGAMTGDEMSEVLRQIGWTAGELARRLSVREDTVRGWLNSRRGVPLNLERWLRQVRDTVNTAPRLPDDWRSGG